MDKNEYYLADVKVNFWRLYLSFTFLNKALDWKFQPVQKLPQEVAKEVHGEVKPNVLPVYKEPESKERVSKYPNALEEVDKIMDSFDHHVRLRAVKKESENQVAETKKEWAVKDQEILLAMEKEEEFVPERFEVVNGIKYPGWKGEYKEDGKRIEDRKSYDIAVREIPADFS